MSNWLKITPFLEAPAMFQIVNPSFSTPLYIICCRSRVWPDIVQNSSWSSSWFPYIFWCSPEPLGNNYTPPPTTLYNKIFQAIFTTIARSSISLVWELLSRSITTAILFGVFESVRRNKIFIVRWHKIPNNVKNTPLYVVLVVPLSEKKKQNQKIY